MPHLHHIALGARDVEGVAAFYRDAIGLRELQRHWYPDGILRSVWLDLEGPILMIEHTERVAERVEGVGAGPFLLAFPALGGRAAAEEAVLAAGATIESRSEFTSYARDPEGNRFAVSVYPTP